MSAFCLRNGTLGHMQTDPEALLEKDRRLIHSENQKVISHTMRDDDCWVLHTLMIDGCEAPFKFKRQQKYKSLKGARVNLTYYVDSEKVAGLQFEIMRVVRIKRT